VTSKPLIYAVDDDVSMNQIMEARFKKFGCDIETFTEAFTVLDAIRKRRPNLLILDLNLGEGFSGFDIIESIRLSFRLDFPIIVVSSESESSKVAHALELGATDYVVKPPFRFQFEEKVAEYIQADQLAAATPVALRSVRPDAGGAKVTFPSSVREVTPLGFTLLSPHLIRKGTMIWLSGEEIKNIVPTAEKVLVTVLGSATRISNDERLYEVRVEIDTSDEKVMQDIKAFLHRAKNGN
jgi:DNA-binding response OmpR family regulator